MTQTAQQILQTIFGYHQFRSPQDEIIQTLIQGDDALVLMPTGGGKSLCYQIPALMRPGTGIVISPLIALMQDQVSTLRQQGVNAHYLNSTLSFQEVRAIEQALKNGTVDLLYIAPERLTQPGMLQLLQQIPIALFAIDEAHCVSQWGHDFRADYLELSLLHQHFPMVPRIALTATADQRTRDEIIARLQLHQARLFLCSFDRPNIQYRIAEKRNARQQLLTFLRQEHPDDAGIVYCLSRNRVETTAQWLTEQGFTALPYHAGLSSDVRQSNQDRFLREENVIVVATIAFGMGIDKPDVRFVAHLDLPKSVEAYYQETGRAGRDGEPATAWMVYGIQDVIKLRQMLDASEAGDEHKRTERHKLDAMLGLCEITSCRRHALLNYFGEDSEVACGNCDTCLWPAHTWDGTVAAQKALSCVFRTGQKFGVNHVIDVLQGKENEKVLRFNHHTQSTFGIGSELDTSQWRSVFRQLIARGYLATTMDGFGSLQLTEKCRAVLKGEESLSLRREVKSGKRASRQTRTHHFDDTDSLLWDALRQQRKVLASEQQIPPYMIFHDATLMEMVSYKPTTPDQLSRINGVGQSKLNSYGDEFLQVIQQHLEQADDTAANDADSKQETLLLFNAGMSIANIATQRQLTEKTIYSHLADHIQAGAIALQEVIELPVEDLNHIKDTILAFDNSDDIFRFKPVFEELGGVYDYSVLHCVRAALLATADA